MEDGPEEPHQVDRFDVLTGVGLADRGRPSRSTPVGARTTVSGGSAAGGCDGSGVFSTADSHAIVRQASSTFTEE
jgi:hypothetical protein